MLFIGLSITYFYSEDHHSFIKNSLIGIKYWLYFMTVFLGAGILWYVRSKEDNQEIWEKKWRKKINEFMNFIHKLGFGILIAWFIIQWSKVLFPELWYNLWFAELNIYKAWMPPPLYYLTQHDGIMRLSGLFSGPNNFAFWLIGMSPFLMQHKSIWHKLLVGISWVANLGRVIVVWWISEICIMAAKNKRINKHLFFVWLGIWCIMWLFAYITYIKWDSTTEHFRLGIDAIHKFLAQPRWYGLWSSGPWVHRNWSLLPENYYLQLALDYWFAGPLLFWLFWFFIIKKIIWSSTVWAWKSESDEITETNQLLLHWFIGMLMAWLFLHVFEDSMVNYLFFIPWGVVYGYNLWRHQTSI